MAALLKAFTNRRLTNAKARAVPYRCHLEAVDMAMPLVSARRNPLGQGDETRRVGDFDAACSRTHAIFTTLFYKIFTAYVASV